MKRAMLAIAGAAAMLGTVPQAAQAQNVDARLDRIEQQLRAVQRSVFPGGDQRFFEPEITPQTQPVQTPTVNASTSALTGVLARLDAIEAQLSRLTAASEVNGNAMLGIETRLAVLEGQTTVAAAAPQSPALASPDTRPTGVIPVPNERREIAAPAELPAVASGPSDARLAAVQAIAKPASGDAGDDEYVYGFRLWDAGFYPEAQQQLALFVERYPNHSRTSFGRNLLGRAFLDAGEPRKAATHFFENYQNEQNGARAPDSLLYLAESMISLGDTNRTCIALAQFGESYPALATGRLQGMYEGLLGRVDCD